MTFRFFAVGVFMTNSKTQDAYRIIKEKIINGELAPRADISEEMLQKELNVSRTPIREAMQLLQKEGFVNVYPRKGIIVTDISIDLLNEIYDVRSINEPFIARKSCGLVPDRLMKDLKDRFLRAPEGYSLETLEQYYSDLDAIFHTSQLQYCGNRFVYDTMRVVADHEKRIRRLAFNVQDNHSCVAEHVEMIDCFLQRDAVKLSKLAYEHVERARSNTFSRFYKSEFSSAPPDLQNFTR